MSVAAGTRFGFYEVLSPIGSGGMGEVYLAYDVRLGRRAALKLLPVKYTADQERVRRFQQEARAASALNHPNIITIFEIGQNHDTHFIAAEFVEGQTVSRRLSGGRIEMSQALDIAIQATGAIAAAHAAGIIHRDIKCENIMIRPDGYVKVLDFGLAKLTETFSSGQDSETDAPTQPLNETSPGMIMGTVNYMSPEQARGYRVDARSDIFSMGIVLYEMLTGKLPFSGNSGSDVVAAILTQEAPPLSRYIADATPELEWIVSKALSKEREGRFQRADEMVFALKRARQQIDFRAEKERSDPDTVVGPTESLHSGASGKTRRGRSYDTNRGFDSNSETVFTQFGGAFAKRRKEVVFVAAILMVAAALGALYFWNNRRVSVVNSIAILPFSALDGTPQTTLLADGMTQGLITSLSQLPKLRVRSLASVLRYRTGGTGSPPDPRQVGLDLDVPLILSGGLSENPNGLTVNLELVDTRDNSHLWGRQYDRKRADLPALQEEITREVSRRLKLNLNAEETAKFEAYQSYLRGRYFLGKRTTADVRQGIESFNSAISLDDGFALAYAGLADSYNLLGTYGALAPDEAFPKAREAAEKALKIDDSLAEAHTSLAFVKHRYEWDWAGAESEFKRAIELDPNYALARQWYSSFLVAMGRSRSAIAEARRSQELAPVSLSVNSHLAWVLYLSRQYDEALAECARIIAIDGNFFPGRRYEGLVYEQLGRHQEAVASLKKARELNPGSTVILGALGHAHAVAGNTQEARRLLQALMSVVEPRRVSSYEVAIVHTGLGETEQAFSWLEKAFTEKNEYLNYLLVDPRFDPLRGDPRFAALVRRIGLPPQR